MPSARRVPWRDAADLDLLSRLVYSDSPQHRRTAINRVGLYEISILLLTRYIAAHSMASSRTFAPGTRSCSVHHRGAERR
jgi:hypothetical protein